MIVSPADAAWRDREMDVAVLVDCADVDEMGEQRASRIELLAIHHEGIAIALNRGFKGADVFAPSLGKGVAEAIALERTAKPQELLLFACRNSDRVQRRQMVLRELTQAWVSGRNDRDDLGESGEGNAAAAIGLGHGNSPKAGPREAIEFLNGQATLVISLRRAFREFGDELPRDGQGLRVGGDPMCVWMELENRRLLWDRDRPADVLVHGGS